MSWRGEFYFGDYWAAFRGGTQDNSLHAHAAIQICLSTDAPAVLENSHSDQIEGHTLVIKPGIQHKLFPISKIMLVFVEPHSAFGQYLLRELDGDMGKLPSEIADSIDMNGPLEGALDDVFALLGIPRTAVDPRLVQALRHLKKSAADRSFSEAASSVGLSAPRLRALAKEQLGVPLTKLLAWHQLNRAAKELAGGASLADAAYAAGYADQAHFTRSMRSLVGVTPKEARRPLV